MSNEQDCPLCFGTGRYNKPDGADDFEVVKCDCQFSKEESVKSNLGSGKIESVKSQLPFNNLVGMQMGTIFNSILKKREDIPDDDDNSGDEELVQEDPLLSLDDPLRN